MGPPNGPKNGSAKRTQKWARHADPKVKHRASKKKESLSSASHAVRFLAPFPGHKNGSARRPHFWVHGAALFWGLAAEHGRRVASSIVICLVAAACAQTPSQLQIRHWPHLCCQLIQTLKKCASLIQGKRWVQAFLAFAILSQLSHSCLDWL